MPKVLVVDDSALMRRLITGVLSEAGYETQIAHNGTEGVEKLVQWQPDVVTLDINMPQMDGLTALSLMMAARPTPVVMVSSLTEEGALATFEALALGAVDFITKPGGTISLSIDEIAQQLLTKVRGALRSRPKMAGSIRTTPQGKAAHSPRAAVTTSRRPPAAMGHASQATHAATHPAHHAPSTPHRPSQATRTAGTQHLHLVLIGVSTGGPRTLEDVLPPLPADLPAAVVVAQHMPPNFTDAFAKRMDRICAMRVREINAPLPLEHGQIYIGQGGKDIILMERLGRLVVTPKPETPGHPWHPSADVLVESAMRHLPAEQLTGVLLTGMGNDGATAMSQLKRHGGRTIAEAESTAVVFGMPQELIQKDGATLVLPCHEIARQLIGWLDRSERTHHGIAKSR